MVCLLKGRGEGERDGGRGRIEREGERERGQGRKLFTSEEPRRKRALVCVYVCVGAATMQVKTPLLIALNLIKRHSRSLNCADLNGWSRLRLIPRVNGGSWAHNNAILYRNPTLNLKLFVPVVSFACSPDTTPIVESAAARTRLQVAF